MTRFNRKIAHDRLKEAGLASAPWFTELLRRWRPSGTASTWVTREDGIARPQGLRLGIRDGYVNFYCGGQSVAKVGLGRNKFAAWTHVKYLSDGAPNVQKYQRLGAADIGIDDWIRRTHRYQGVEKTFVERLVEHNPTVVDLEIALPGMEATAKAGKPCLVAPRIDLAALEPASGGGWRLVFWEAKLSRDKRVRSNTTPEVVGQLAKYRDWFTRANRAGDVLEAYRDSIAATVALHTHARQSGIEIPDLHPAIVEIKENRDRLVSLDPAVRLVIRLEEGGDTAGGNPKFLQRDMNSLKAAGIEVHQVSPPEDARNSLLPPLE